MATLSELLQLAIQKQTTQKQADELKQKANNLDVIASYASVRSTVPSTGLGWFGTYKFFVDWENDGSQAARYNHVKNPSCEVPISNTTNYALNPSFEVNITNDWYADDGTGGTISQSSTYAKYGTYSVKMTGASDQMYIASITSTVVATGSTVVASAWVRTSTAAASKAILLIQENDDDYTQFSLVYNTVASGTGWERLTAYWTNSGASENVRVVLLDHYYSAEAVYWDGVQIEVYPTYVYTSASEYCDGSLGTGYAWDGTAHNSISTLTGCHWTRDMGGGAERDTTRSVEGSYSAKLTAGPTRSRMFAPTLAEGYHVLANGATVSMSLYMYCSSSPTGSKAGMIIRHVGTADRATVYASTTGSWERLEATWTNTTGSPANVVIIAFNDFNNSATPVWVDCALVEESSAVGT